MKITYQNYKTHQRKENRMEKCGWISKMIRKEKEIKRIVIRTHYQ